MFKRIDHIEIVPRDIEASIKFYTDILNFEIRERVSVGVPPLREVVYLVLGDTMLELLSVASPSPPSGDQWQSGYRMMAVEVADMDKALEYLERKGIRPSWGPVNLGTSKRAEIKDPDGTAIELREW